MTQKYIFDQKYHKKIERQQYKRKQNGYLMISVMISLFAIGAMITLYVERQAERVRLERGEQLGYALATLGDGFTAYLDENYIELVNNQPQVNGFPDPLRPTAKQLIDKLSIRGVAPDPPVIANASYKFQVSFAPGCTVKQKQSEVRCRPIGLAYIDRPLVRGKSGVDYVALARAARVMKGHGGYARPESPSEFTFLDTGTSGARFPVTNPTGLAGVLAWRADPLSGDEERLKTNGSNRMKNTLRLDGDNEDHDLVGVKDITASGDLITAGRLQVKGGESSKPGQPTKTWGVTVDNNAIIKGDFNVDGEARIKQLSVAKETQTDTLYFSKLYNIGEFCSGKGSTGQDKNGNWVQCKNNKWQFMASSSFEAAIMELSSKKFRNRSKTLFVDLGAWLYCGQLYDYGEDFEKDGLELWRSDNSLTWRVRVPNFSKIIGTYKFICYGAVKTVTSGGRKLPNNLPRFTVDDLPVRDF